LLRAGVAGLTGVGLASVLQASTPRARARSIIFLHQFGGPSHIDTFDMKPDAPAEIRGNFRPIATDVPGLTVSEHLPRMARVMRLFAQVRSVHHGITNHNPAAYYSLSGHEPPNNNLIFSDTRELYPGYGGVAARFRPAEDPAVPSWVSYPHVILDGVPTPAQNASFLGTAYDPLFVAQNPNRPDFRLPELSLPDDLTPDRLDDRRGLLQLVDAQAEGLEWAEAAGGLDTYRRRALRLLTSREVRRAFDLSREDPKLRDAYGRTTYGQGCLLARRLVEAGVRFVTVYFSKYIGGDGEESGWDTHAHNTKQLRDRLLPVTDMAVPTLVEDLRARGLLDETLVVWMGEFGRTPRITNTKRFGPDGRDHWPRCYTALLAGGGIRGGAVYGASDRLAAFPATDPARPDDIAATMFWALGINPATEVHDRLARPSAIAAGRPLTELFA
jgi:hypothetical protein